MRLLYLSGPYSGPTPYHVAANIEMAGEIAVKLWNDGFYVLTPHLNTAGFEYLSTAPYEQFIDGDLRMIDGVDAVVMLPGWTSSRGANIERDYALEKGIPVYEYPDLPDLAPPSILAEATRLVHGPRQAAYGRPYDDFQRTAQFWTTALEDLLKPGAVIEPQHIALCMILLKVSREIHRPKRDNRTDIAGYSEALDLVWQDIAQLEKFEAFGEG